MNLREFEVPLSTDHPSMKRHALATVIRAGMYLMLNGHGRLRLLPTMQSSGEWHCLLHPQDNASQPLFSYRAAQGLGYLASHCGGTVPITASPKDLAQAILVSVPENLKRQCEGVLDPSQEQWLGELQRALADGFIPAWDANASDPPRDWKLVDLAEPSRQNHLTAYPGFDPGLLFRGVEELDEWASPSRRWRARSRSGWIMVAAGSLTDAGFNAEVIHCVQQASQGVSSRGHTSFLQGLMGRLIEHDAPAPFPRPNVQPVVSTEPSQDIRIHRSRRLLSMVHELHKVGYQGLRIAAGRDSLRGDWRVHLVPDRDVAEDGWTPLRNGPWPTYSDLDGQRYFGWSDCSNDKDRALANKFIARFPVLAQATLKQDWAYAGWFSEVLGKAEQGELPVLYGGGSGPRPGSLPPAPTMLGRPDDAAELDKRARWYLPTQCLTLKDLPSEEAPREAVEAFCRTHDAEHGGLISHSDMDRLRQEFLRDERGSALSLDDLRTVGYLLQRDLKNHEGNGEDQITRSLVHALRGVVRQIRTRLTDMQSHGT